MALNVLTSYSLNSDELALQIHEKIGGKRHLLVCATKNIKDVRSENPLFSEAAAYKNGLSDFTLATFSELTEFLRKDIFKNKKTIRVSDERYILLKTIQFIFKDDEKQLSLFTELRFQLYELYAFLLFHDAQISDETIDEIGAAYSCFEKDIFTIYQTFSGLLYAIRTNSVDSDAAAILGNGITFGISGLDTINNRIKTAVRKCIAEVDVLILDGFLFFDDMQRYMIEQAVKLKKDVYLTAKNSDIGGYMFNYVYPSLFADLKQEYIPPSYIPYPSSGETALHYVKQHYLHEPQTALPHLQDGSISFIQPFPNRELEWQYIVEQISNLLQAHGGNDIKKLKSILKNDIAVVIAHKGYEERFINLFRETGLFVFKGEQCLQSLSLRERVVKDFADVYFKRADFLNEKIYFENGEPLSYAEKLKMFKESFDGITIKKPRSPITSYPVGQYVFKVYDVLLNGMSISAFKAILYSNWEHTISGGAKWDEYLSDFNILEVFYEKQSSLDGWISITENLISMKQSADADNALRYHPLRPVAATSLTFFYELLRLFRELVTKVGVVSGGLKEHVAVLKETVIGKLPSWNETDFEQKIVMDLLEAVDQIKESSLVQNMSARYFAENLHAMLRDYEQEIETDNKSDMELNIVILINISHYKYCFFPMFEANKYPRKMIESFPFSDEILEILSSDDFGINKRPPFKGQYREHIGIEDYHIKNVIDFTTEKLIFTMTEKEDEHRNSISHYAHDITTLFDSEIPWEKVQLTRHQTTNTFNAGNMTPMHLPVKEQYTVLELMTFLLCPRLYLHQQTGSPVYTSKFLLQFYFAAILFSESTREFCLYNRKNKVIYNADRSEAEEKIKLFFQPVYKKYLPLFPIFTAYELSDIQTSVLSRLAGSVADIRRRGIKGNRYTILDVDKQPIFKLNGFNLVLEYDTKIYDLDNRSITRISQNSIFIDFLTLKTTETPEDAAKKYKHMKSELEQHNKDSDRVNIIWAC